MDDSSKPPHSPLSTRGNTQKRTLDGPSSDTPISDLNKRNKHFQTDPCDDRESSSLSSAGIQDGDADVHPPQKDREDGMKKMVGHIMELKALMLANGKETAARMMELGKKSDELLVSWSYVDDGPSILT